VSCSDTYEVEYFGGGVMRLRPASSHRGDGMSVALFGELVRDPIDHPAPSRTARPSCSSREVRNRSSHAYSIGGVIAVFGLSVAQSAKAG
jgi:hypothetical protein